MTKYIGIVDSRDFTDYEYFKERVSEVLTAFTNIVIVSGGAKGADSLAERYAEEHNIPIIVYKADWSRGRKAGPERNTLIVARSDYLLAFPSANSVGTLDTINKAKKKGISVAIFPI